MEIKKAADHILFQLQEVVYQVSEEDFRKPIEVLSNSSLGQHIRHTLEFFICLSDGYNSGKINYDKRSHDTQIENDKDLSLDLIARMREFILKNTSDQNMILEASYDPVSDQNNSTVNTTYLRELVYNIEHTIHHMAILKIGIRDLCPYVNIPEGFGVAVSTLKYRAKYLNQ